MVKREKLKKIGEGLGEEVKNNDRQINLRVLVGLIIVILFEVN